MENRINIMQPYRIDQQLSLRVDTLRKRLENRPLNYAARMFVLEPMRNKINLDGVGSSFCPILQFAFIYKDPNVGIEIMHALYIRTINLKKGCAILEYGMCGAVSYDRTF